MTLTNELTLCCFVEWKNAGWICTFQSPSTDSGKAWWNVMHDLHSRTFCHEAWLWDHVLDSIVPYFQSRGSLILGSPYTSQKQAAVAGSPPTPPCLRDHSCYDLPAMGHPTYPHDWEVIAAVVSQPWVCHPGLRDHNSCDLQAMGALHTPPWLGDCSYYNVPVTGHPTHPLHIFQQ